MLAACYRPAVSPRGADPAAVGPPGRVCRPPLCHLPPPRHRRLARHLDPCHQPAVVHLPQCYHYSAGPGWLVRVYKGINII